LIEKLNDSNPWLMCSLIHKFASNATDREGRPDVPGFIQELRAALPAGFNPKGEIFVFVDECHRTQSNLLHAAMREILPEATMIGFTGTPLLKRDKARSIEVFGPYIHTYKYDEAEEDGVVVGLRYEARDIAQRITSQTKIDQWFAAKTKGLNAVARAQLKARWGTMQQVLSSSSRLDAIVSDIVFDMSTRDRLSNGRGNALLVASSIYEACVYYELFQKTVLKGHVGVVTSYVPTLAALKGESTGEGETLPVAQFNAYRQMLADWFHISPDEALAKVEQYEKEAKAKFVDEPGQLKLLIVVDKLLTGFDAPSATYLYIDKSMQDHGLFQAICRVNRLDGDDKEYGFIVDYKDLFKSLEGAVRDYTSEAFDAFDHDDVAGLLKDRIESAKSDFEDALEAVRALVEPVENPKDSAAYLRFFCAVEDGSQEQLKENEPKRVALYDLVGKAVRTFANLAGDYEAAGYTDVQFEALRQEIAAYEGARAEVKLASGDYIDLKAYEPAMRHLIDTYISADESNVVSAFDDMSLVQLLVKRGEGAVDALPKGLRSRATAAATIENNVRRLIIDERPANPKYYDKMSEILDALIAKLRENRIAYQEYLKLIVELAKQVSDPSASESYPDAIKTPGLRAIFDLIGEDEGTALAVDAAVRGAMQDGWRDNPLKTGRIRKAIAAVLPDQAVLTEELLELVKVHGEY
jgi:type I restriction enzyme R subunit